MAVSEESCAPHQAVFAVRLFKHAYLKHAYLPTQVVTVEYATADGTGQAHRHGNAARAHGGEARELRALLRELVATT